MVAAEISEKKRAEQERTKATEENCKNADKILSAEMKFLDYLEEINCNNATYDELISRDQILNGITSSYDVLHVQQVLDNYKKQLNEFMHLGGDPNYVCDLNKMDLYIEIVKRLKEYSWLDKQEKYVKFAEDTYCLDQDWEKECNATINEVDNLSGIEFEKICMELIRNMGFSVENTKASGDGGIDLIAYNHQPLLSGRYIIQCKRYSGSVGEPILRDLYGVVTAERANKGILITTGHFTKNAIGFAEGKNIELIDGPNLKNLMNQYGLYTNNENKQISVDIDGKQDIINIAQEMWELWDETDYEEDYYTLIELKEIADNSNDEREVAKYVNWLLEKVDFDAFDICTPSQQFVFWNEINRYIQKFLEIRTFPKSKLLSYLYQMKFVQNSILLGRFTDAKIMFIKLMKDTGIQFTLYETIEPDNTAEIFENTGVFTFLFATWCNMYQMAFVSNDRDLKEYLNDNRLFYGVPILQNNRIEDNLELIHSGKSGLNEVYFQKLQNLIQEINEWYTCEPVKTKIFFRIENVDIIKSFFEYAYNNGATQDDLIEFCEYTIENGKMVIDYYATIDLDNALQGYIPLTPNDLNK